MSTPSTALPRVALIRLQAGICLASFLGCLDFTIVNTALPAIGRQFNSNVDELHWVMTLFVMSLCCCMVLSARLGEVYGRGRLLYAGMLLFAVTSLGAGLTTGPAALNLFRLLQGAGCAVLYTLSAAILIEIIPEAKRGRALGMLFAVNGLGLTLGPIAGGVLVSLSGWRSVFLINVPLLLLSYSCCAGVVSTGRPENAGSVDLRGWLWLVATLVPVLLASVTLSPGGAVTWATAALLVIGTVAGITLVRIEKRTPEPLIAFGLFRNRLFRRACLLSVLLAIFYCAAFLLMPFRLLEIYRLSDARLGLMLLPVTLVMAIVSPLAGRYGDRFGPWPVLTLGFVMLTASALLQSLFTVGQPLVLNIAAFALMGVGWGAILGPSVAAALSAMPSAFHAQGIGLSWTLHNLGGVVGLSVATQIYRAGGQGAGYRWVMWLLAALALAGALTALSSARRVRAERTDAAGQSTG